VARKKGYLEHAFVLRTDQDKKLHVVLEKLRPGGKKPASVVSKPAPPPARVTDEAKDDKVDDGWLTPSWPDAGSP
jgi:hypothetical protein